MTASTKPRWRGWVVFGLVLVLATVVGVGLTGLQADWVQMLHAMRDNPTMLLTATVIYAICLAIPYVPGVELGLMLMIVFGRAGILMAYGGTLIGLTLAFLLGSFLSGHFLGHAAFKSWREKASRFTSDSNRQLEQSKLGSWLQPQMARFRRAYPYLVIGVLLNLPGNWLIGGGGGIAFVGGLSGRLRWVPFALAVALFTCVVPLLVWFGLLELERFLPVMAGPH